MRQQELFKSREYWILVLRHGKYFVGFPCLSEYILLETGFLFSLTV